MSPTTYDNSDLDNGGGVNWTWQEIVLYPLLGVLAVVAGYIGVMDKSAASAAVTGLFSLVAIRGAMKIRSNGNGKDDSK